jgi:hypothetical protein
VRPYGPEFAMLLAIWTGDRRALACRLLDPNITLTMPERRFLATVLDPAYRWPRGGWPSVQKRRKQLHAAATFLHFSLISKLPRKQAIAHTARQHKISDRAVEANLKFAKGLRNPDGGPWG